MSERTLRFRIVILKVCLLLTLLSIFSVAIYAQKSAAGDQNAVGDRLTMNAKNVTYREVFSEIKRQTGKVVWYDSNFDDTRKINIAFKDTPLSEVMNFILKNTGLSWRTRNEAILINGKDIDKSVGASPKGISTNQSRTGMSDTLNNLIDVTGTVTDEHESPIPGATVLLKGTQNGTVSNAEGFFRLKGVSKGASIVITNISFSSKEVTVNQNGNVGIVRLSKFIGQLDETVILAYTKTTNRVLTGNVSSIKSKDLRTSTVNNPILAVAGRVPGVQIVQSSGVTGGGVDIVVQGLNSLRNGSSPFYIVDGVPYAQSLLKNFGDILRFSGRGSGDGPVNGSPLSFINPADIESIEILKDADATAIYGSRAANGAIIITTKRGRTGKMRTDVNYQMGFNQVARRLDLLNTSQYLELRKEAIANGGGIPGANDYDLNGTWDSTKNTNWQKELIGNKAKFKDASLTMQGGSDNLQYYFGSTYHKETTVFDNKLSDEKISVRFNMDATSQNKKLKFNLSASFLNDNNKLPNTDLTRSAMTLPPLVPVLKNNDGTLNWGTTTDGVSSFMNPLAFLSEKYVNKTQNMIGNGLLSYVILDGLTLKSSFGYTSLSSDEMRLSPITVVPPELRPYSTRSAIYGYNKINTWIIEPQLNYSKIFGRSDLNVLLGSSFQNSNNNRKAFSGSGYTSDFVLENISAATSVAIIPGQVIISNYKYAAGFAQLSYNYDNKFIINLSGRRDGSSRFGSKNRFHNFGAIGAGWIFSNEQFFKVAIPQISYGKLKVSYGSTGNDQIGDYGYLALYQTTNPPIPYRGGSSLTNSNIGNASLKWEETKKLNIGVDFGVFKDRLLLSTNYYRNRSSNMLIATPLPSLAGPLGGLIANLPAVIQNSGWEVSINTVNIDNKNFRWSTNINITVPKNKLIRFDDLEKSTYANAYELGESVNIIKTIRSAGVNSLTGRYQFYDVDGKITDEPLSRAENFTHVFNPNPSYYGGINNSLSYKGFTLDFLVYFIKQIGQNIPYNDPPGWLKTNYTKAVLNRWRKPGDENPIQQVKYGDGSYDVANYYQNISDAYWGNASFIRIKNVFISYNIPLTAISKMGLGGLKVYLSGQNLWTITNYKGLDPESQSNFTLPPLRTFSIGAQISL